LIGVFIAAASTSAKDFGNIGMGNVQIEGEVHAFPDVTCMVIWQGHMNSLQGWSKSRGLSGKRCVF
jgi:hypothetical protein